MDCLQIAKDIFTFHCPNVLHRCCFNCDSWESEKLFTARFLGRVSDRLRHVFARSGLQDPFVSICPLDPRLREMYNIEDTTIPEMCVDVARPNNATILAGRVLHCVLDLVDRGLSSVDWHKNSSHTLFAYHAHRAFTISNSWFIDEVLPSKCFYLFWVSGQPLCSPPSVASQMVVRHMTALPCKNGFDSCCKKRGITNTKRS